MRHALAFSLLSCCLALPSQAQPPAAERVESKGGMVVCVSPPAAEVGVGHPQEGRQRGRCGGRRRRSRWP